MGKPDHVRMLTRTVAPTLAEADPEALLTEVVASGWTRLIVPRPLGGEGATHLELAEALLQLARRHPAAAWMAWSQGLVIEALIRSGNVALREHVLPDLLDGSRAGSVSWSPDFGLAEPPQPVSAVALDRGWHLSGRLDEVLNLQWMGYVVLCPVWFEAWADQPARLGWTLLRSEEDGLRHELDRSRPLTRQSACGTLHLHRVYFREDELVADHADALSASLRVLDHALRRALWDGALR